MRIEDAIRFEKQLKGWSRAKKTALLEKRWGDVAALAKRRAGKPR